MIWILKESNSAATDYYFEVIKEAAEKNFQVKIITKINKNEIEKNSYIVVGSITKAWSAYMKGYKNIIIWFQGLAPEESFMRNKKNIRRIVLNKLEKNMLKKAKLSIFVSDAMRVHYETKYSMEIKHDYYVMPCFNTGLEKKSFATDKKYQNNQFVYIGSLSPWQGFDKILNIYESIEKDQEQTTELLVLTSEKEKALKAIKKSSIKNYTVDYTTLDKLPSFLEKSKFGFVIRENNPVNNVSTPTKLSSYMANGVIPIYTSNIRDFHKEVDKFKYVLCLDSNNYIDNIEAFMNEGVDKDKIFEEYSVLFDSYFNKSYHIQKLSEVLVRKVRTPNVTK